MTPPNDEKQAKEQAEQGTPDLGRRKFFALTAGAAGAATVAGLGIAGVVNGGSPATATGWADRETLETSPFFDRTPFEVDKPTYQIVGPQRRIHWTERVVERTNAMAKYAGAGQKDKAVLGAELVAYYEKHPQEFDLDLERVTKIFPARAEQAKKDADEMLLTNLYDKAWYTVKPEIPGRPKEADWKDVSEKKYEVKDEVKVAQLIKKLAHSFGAAVVGITKLNPAWVYRE